MLGVFAATQFGLIYGTVRLVLFFDLPPASSITILMEMVSVCWLVINGILIELGISDKICDEEPRICKEQQSASVGCDSEK